MDSRELTVALDGKVYEAGGGDNLLESLLSQGAYVRHGCRAGACGACRLYDVNHCESILSCQTLVSCDMSLSTHSPSRSFPFSIESTHRVGDSAVELTLLGPCDESFGDRVAVAFSQDEAFVECMALNPAGASLTILAQKGPLSEAAWQAALSLSVGDKVQVQTSSGVRKGRLLFEMGVSDLPVVVVSSADNGLFSSYWRGALQEHRSNFLGHFALPVYDDVSLRLSDEAFSRFLKEALEGSGGASLQLIYHGQNVSSKEWQQALRGLRVRAQVHFVR